MQTDEKLDFQKRIPELDGIRGFAMIMVLISHFAEWGTYAGSNIFIKTLLAISFAGFTGLDLFFVLSGFLICGILIDNREALNYYKVFYVRRTLRVFPLYYLLLTFFSLIVLASVYKIINTPEWLFGFQFPPWAYFTYTQNIFMSISNSFGTAALGPTWSLAVEEQFYLTFPFIVRFVPRRYLVHTLLSIVIGAIIFRIFLFTYYPANPYAALMLTPSRADSLLIGALAAIALRSETATQFFIKNRSSLYLIIPLAGILSCLGIASYYYIGVIQIIAALIFTMIAIMYVTLIILCLTSSQDAAIRRFFRNRVLLEFGTLSYFIYLTHIGVLQFYHWQFGIFGKTPIGMIWFIEIILALVTCLLLAKLSQRYLEKPLIRLGHKFKYEPASSKS